MPDDEHDNPSYLVANLIDDPIISNPDPPKIILTAKFFAS
jgi:hypothetical protein